VTSAGRKFYFGVIERDGAGGWTGDVPDVPGCRIRASTLREARLRLRAVFISMVEDSETAWLRASVTLPAYPSEPLPRRRRARKAAEARRRDAETAYAEFGEEVGVSGPRVREIVTRTLRRLERLSRDGE
jgi:predicted RNase H-like HicB family nuclease